MAKDGCGCSGMTNKANAVRQKKKKKKKKISGTVTCLACNKPVPKQLYITYSNPTVVKCLDGLTVSLVFDGVQSWVGARPNACAKRGGVQQILKCYPYSNGAGGQWGLYNDLANTTGAYREPLVVNNCDPFFYQGRVNVGSQGDRPGYVDITIKTTRD